MDDVLLAGATGYLGVHVLKELLTTTNANVYCLVRAKENSNGVKHLKYTLNNYFVKNYAELFDSRIFVIEGDATDSYTLKNFEPNSQMTVINCAASVKHFAKNNEIELTNVNSVKNSARLVHISTASVSGGRKNNMPPVNSKFNEKMLFVEQ